MAQTVPADLAGAVSRLLGGVPGRVVRAASGAVLAVRGDVVVKVHPVGTDAPALRARLRAASDPALDGVLVAPLRTDPVPLPDGATDRGRVATLWPRLDVLDPGTPRAPWAAAAATLAALHRTPLPTLSRAAATPAAGLPPHGAPQRLRRAVLRLAPLAGAPAADAVARAGRRVLAEDGARQDGARQDDANTLVHGDWHLGQLGRDSSGRWLLLDLDDLGTGDPAWDLGRPAGFCAAGLLDPDVWAAFLAAYRTAGGPAVPPDGDPWPALDVPARAEVVVAAARAVHRARSGTDPWDDEAQALLDACARM